jgi:aspartate/glutamate racemase
MWSFDFGEIEALQHAGRWDDAAAEMIAAAQRLERDGADFVVICTNTMHRMADQVQAAISLPLLHIADPVSLPCASCREAARVSSAHRPHALSLPRNRVASA